jgi:hypothetical protein
LVEEYELFLFIKHLGELIKEFLLCELPDLRNIILDEIKFFGEIINAY